MSRNSNITSIETISCDAGWRNYYFVKITTTGDVVGWSEYDESFGPKGVTQNINIMGVELIGQSVLNHESIYNQLFRKKRGMFGGVVAQAMGAIENALLDAKAKLLGLPCYELLGGKLRDVIRVYWSHCGPWRMKPRAQYYCDKELESLGDIEKLAFEARQSGFNALKTYPYYLNKVGEMRMWSPGFGQPFQPDLNFDRKFLRDLRDYLEAFRKGAGPDMDIMLDLNFNAHTEGITRITRELNDFDLFWLEVDHNDPEALAEIRSNSPFPIASCETLLTKEKYLQYFRSHSIDVGIVDVVWNGAWQSMKIAAVADAHGISVAPHNFYGHLATMMSAHFSAAIPNFNILETDIDRLSWDEEVFLDPPIIREGHLILSDKLGWGCDPDEKILYSRSPKN